jgi:hypothetical protein
MAGAARSRPWCAASEVPHDVRPESVNIYGDDGSETLIGQTSQEACQASPAAVERGYAEMVRSGATL